MDAESKASVRVDQWYHPDWGELSEMDAFYTHFGQYAHTREPRHQRIAELVQGPRVLDYGCGSGDLLLILQDEHPGWQLTGVDISGVALSMARARGVRAALHETLPGGQYDTIVLAQVLEHVEDDAGLVSELSERLAPGGLLIVTVPFEDRLRCESHVHEYTWDSLLAMLGGGLMTYEMLGTLRMLAVVQRP